MNSSFGTSFLDLLSSAMISILLLYVLSPNEWPNSSQLKSASFTLDSRWTGKVELIACIQVRSVVHCSSERDLDGVNWTSSPKKSELSVSWYGNASEPGEFWVAVSSDDGSLQADSEIEVRIAHPNGEPTVTSLARSEQFTAIGDLR